MAKPEYIDRKAFLDYMKGTSRYFNVKFDIENFPAADVAPVVHGRWIGAPLCGNDNCRCSECGSWHNIHANLRGEIIQKYCPNCGAKMDSEETDNG